MIRVLRQCLILGLALFFASTTLVWADYQQGLDAYIEGDFARAQSLWHASTKQNDARSMFNLGLLHQQLKIESASLQQAEIWFTKAAEQGYMPAAYHLGISVLSERRQQGLEWIQKASAAGYVPAQKYLANLNGIDASQVSVENSNSSSLRAETWINKQDSARWTIQLLAFNELSKVEAFVEEHDLHQEVAYFREPSRDVMFFKLIYGSYVSKETAQAARESLASDLSSHGPWLRPFAEVKSAIAALEK